MAEIRLTRSGVHYFHLLMKVYAGSKTSAQLNWTQAVQAANYQMMIVANDKEMIKAYALLAVAGLICASSFYGHAASLDIIIGLVAVSVAAPVSAYIQIITAERYKLSLSRRYGVWLSLGALNILGFFLALSHRLVLMPVAWIFATLFGLVLIMSITHLHYREALHFKNFLDVSLKSTLQDMLASHVKGRVIRLSARDKYVSVRTCYGECEIRFTLSEAIKANAQPGYRIHRSHWVAEDSIIDLYRKNKKWFLTVEGSETFPVSEKVAPQIEAERTLKTKKWMNDVIPPDMPNSMQV